MKNFIEVVRGVDVVSRTEALSVFEVLAPVIGAAPEHKPAIDAARDTIARVFPRDDLVGVLLDWWLVVTAGSDPPLGHAYTLPGSVPNPLRDAMKNITDLTHRVHLPPGRWAQLRRELDGALGTLDEVLTLDSYGTSKLPGERAVWAELVRALAPVVTALRAGQQTDRFELDHRRYASWMEREGIDENSRRWNEMMKRARECVDIINRIVDLHQQVRPWVNHNRIDTVDALPPGGDLGAGDSRAGGARSGAQRPRPTC